MKYQVSVLLESPSFSLSSKLNIVTSAEPSVSNYSKSGTVQDTLDC